MRSKYCAFLVLLLSVSATQLTTSQLNQNGLTLADTSRVTLLPGGATSRITSLTVGAGATLDVTDNALVIDYAGTSPAVTVRSHILSGRGGAGLGKTWNGAGITSSTAAQVNATAPDSRSVGYAENALLPLGAYITFRGQAVDTTSILIVYTRTADANLDGIVANDDVTVVGGNYAPGAPKPIGSAWALGDFEYNGSVDNDDVTLLGVFYNPAANPPPPTTLSPGLVSTELVAGRPGVEAVAALTSSSPPGKAGGLGWQESGRLLRQVESATAVDLDALVELLAESIAARGAGDSLADARLAMGCSNAPDELWADELWADAG